MTGDFSTSYPVSLHAGGFDDRIRKQEENRSYYPLTEQEEEWETKRKVSTVTQNKIERRQKRQVVLEDGRVIAEDDPEVTVDVTEDTRTHEDDDDEAKLTTFDDNRGPWVQSYNGDKGGTVLGEKYSRQVRTNDVKTRSKTTAGATNLGELSLRDVDKVVQDGRDVRKLVRLPNYSDTKEVSTVLRPRILHENRSHNRQVDKEDVHEVSRLHNGRVQTDRFVQRELVNDEGEQTPEEGSDIDSEFFDGDGERYTQRKEERFIDYYQVPQGQPTSSGKHLRRGIHMVSQDKEGRRLDPPSRRNRAINYQQYDDQSDSTNTDWSHKPPRPSRTSGGVAGAVNRSKKTSQVSDSQRFHTIERSHRVPSPSPVGAPRSSRQSPSTGPSRHRGYASNQSTGGYSNKSRQSDVSDRSYRSRSMSRSSNDIAKPISKTPSHHHSGRLRSDLDSDREGRLRRTLSFNGAAKTNGKDKHLNGKDKGFFGSVKSLYASITKPNKNKKRSSSNMSDWFDSDQGSRGGGPVRPPRKHRSSSYLADSSSTLNRSQQRYPAGDPQVDYKTPDRTRKWTSYTGATTTAHSFTPSSNKPLPQRPRQASPQRNRYSSPQRTGYPSPQRTRYSSPQRPHSQERQTERKPVQRRRTLANYDDLDANRDPPHFEGGMGRRRGSRFFGDPSDEEVAEAAPRPAPDMRRLLLNNVNVTRRKSMGSKDMEGIRPTVRAI